MPRSFRKTFWLVALVLFILDGCAGTPNSSPQEGGSQQLSRNLQWLASEPYIAHGFRHRKAVALTFDADMTPFMLQKLKSGKVKSYYDQRIVETLTQDQVPATFFITGMWAETYPDAMKNFARNKNFEIENHSYDHAAFEIPCYNLSFAIDPKQEITKAQQSIERISGVTPHFFRFPGGCFHGSDLELVHSLGLIPVQWDVVSGDAYLKDPSLIAKQVIAQVQSGSIVVFHLNGAPNAPATADALPTIIKNLRAQGYSFETLQNILS